MSFDEERYLRANPDVALAVRSGQFLTGRQHYERHGRSEQRPLRSTDPSREEKILRNVDRQGAGLEIGPSHRPVAPKRLGYDVQILDHLDTAGLRAKYADGGHGVDIEQIEEVDYVWTGEPLAALVGDRRFDWIIASHVIEHTPDFIDFVNQCATLLRPEGVLSLAIPDKRYCFDHFRELTSLAQIIDAHDGHATRHSVGTVAEYFLTVAKKNGVGAWEQATAGTFELFHGLDDALSVMDRVRHGEYVDVHAWCFTPASFRLLIEDLASLKMITLRESSFFDTVGHEFFVSLTAGGTGSGLGRLALLEAKQRELGS